MNMRKVLSTITASMLLISSMPAVMANTEAMPQEPYVEETQTAGETTQIELAAKLPYQDTSLSFEERAADLVARMTLEEKAAQTAAKSTPAISRLGVHSYYYWREGIHGVARQGVATSFPSSLSISNTWNRQLMFEAMDITSTEARAKNNRYDLNYWNPTINLARDPRWGRNEESYGEDPYLTAEIGGSAVKGMQGTDEKYLKTITTLKHYAANNCEGERQSGTSVMNDSTLREYYLRAFRDITEKYTPGAVMSSYNGTTVYRSGEILSAMDGQKIDYIASSANSYLINDLLKRTFGFSGFVVGDCGAWDNAYGRQPLRKKLYPDVNLDNITAAMTVAKIIKAGSSLDCNSGANGTGQVAAAVKEGLISEDELDIAVYELFLQRMKTGEFDDGAKYQDITPSVIETDEHVAKAEQAAEESWVLLENNGVLPLKGKKTADTENSYDITDAVFTDKNTLSVSYTKKDDAPADARLFAATYSDTDAAIMTACQNIAVDGSGHQTISISRPENGISKVFIWDGTSSAKPLSTSETVGKISSSAPINIAIVGGHANEVILGDYSGEPTKTTTPYEGITNAVKAVNPESNVELIGNVNDKTPLFNIKSITLVKSTGKNTTLDLSTATKVNGMTKDGSSLTNITKSGVACIPSVDFKDVTDIQIEAASLPGMPNASVSICYESVSQPAADISIASTNGANDYKLNTGTYNGATGGYTATADLYIKINASADFSVENFKDSLDKADYIIAYGGTTTADSGESNDRASIDLPATESHVQQLCDAYPDKTIVALQTVGQVNVESIKDNCAALLWTSYNGQTQGEALGKILTGAVNPSGKLSTTWYTKADLDKMPIGSARTKEDGIDYNYTNYELSHDINNPEADYPGRTYQYYTGTPVYAFGYGASYTDFEYSNITVDKTNADANDIVTITADVTNTGNINGSEVAQLYISVPGADGKKLPLKQLKGFEKIELEPWQTKTVSFSLDISDVYFFDEATQQNYVVTGEYTAKIGGSSDDANAQTIKFNVSGSIAETLKNVYVIPSGLKVYGAKDSTGVVPASELNAGASVTLKNDKLITDFAANGITVTYKSSDENIAAVDSSGIVKAGSAEGTATITVTASKDGSSVTTTFPVVSQFKDKISDTTKESYIKQLEDAYNSCPEVAYTSENWQQLTSIYNETHSYLEAALLDNGLSLMVSKAIQAIYDIPKISLTEEYTIEAVNPNMITDNRIEYSPNGIGTYTATETTITGTITIENPAIIDMQAMNGSDKVTDDLIWTVERLDGSSRKNAEIDVNSGVMKLYENGIYKITASNYLDKKCGAITVFANLQVEAESADDSGGANLSDVKSGTSGGKNAGSTGSCWMRFDGVKLSRLTDITFRVSQKNAASTINVSLQPNADWIIATATAPVTGDWSRWTEVTADINRNDLNKLTLDENGCGTIYVQTNQSNLDYIKLGYNNSDLDAYCLTNGCIGVNVSASTGTLVSTVGGAEKSRTEITSAGNYTLSGFSAGDEITISVLDSSNQPVGNSVNITYTPAKAKDLIVYNFSDAIFNSFFDSAEGTHLTSGLGMDGDGGWNTDKGGSYKYNDRTYTFTRSLKGGKGEVGARRVYFTPDADGAVTAFFNASNTRCMYIEQGSNKVEKYGNGSICEIQMNVKAGEPVYVYGGGSNKNLYGVIFEANKTVVEATPPPTATPIPTEAPLPDTDQVIDVEFEDFEMSWTSGAKQGSTNKAANGKMIENTKNGDIFYFGEYNTEDLLVVNLRAAIREDAGVASAEFFAADTTGIDVKNAAKADIEKLLTSNNSLGKKTLISDPSKWDNYYDHNIVLGSALTGTKGIFVKLTSDGKYAGNHDYIQLKYNLGSKSLSMENDILTAENDLAKIMVSSDRIYAADKYDGTTSEISYNDEYGQNVSFEKLIRWNDMIAAIVRDNESGESSIITSAMGTVWMDVTPDYYAEKDTSIPDKLVFNDMIAADGQLYLGCDNGTLVTMTACTKCTTAKKVCNFDIKSLERSDNKLIMTGSHGEQEEISLTDARQDNIKGEAAKAMAKDGALLVDVRSSEEFAEYNIDGSINVPIDTFEEWLQTNQSDSTIIVYCSAGSRAAKAMEIAAEYGVTNIYNLGSINELK